jgi:hypothetical protein
MIRSITETPVLARTGRMSQGSLSSLTSSSTVVMAPGPASIGISRGKIETSSRSLDTINMRMPPAMKNEPGWMPRKRRIALPVKMNRHSTAKAATTDLITVTRRLFGGSPPRIDHLAREGHRALL